MQVVETLWFSTFGGICGIVLGKEDRTGDPVAYIGVVGGRNEKTDTDDIVSWGIKFHRDTATRILHHFSSKKTP